MSDNNYLNVTHPELSIITPRYGGRANLLKNGPPPSATPRHIEPGSDKSSMKRRSKKGVTIKDNKSSTGSLTGMHKGFGKLFESAIRLSQASLPRTKGKMDDMTKEYRVFKGTDATPWAQQMDEILDDALRYELPNPLQDSVDILAVAISTLMLLAIDYKNTPREHLIWTLSYLKCIRNDVDQYPPNVQGIINHIQKQHSSLASLTSELDFGEPNFHSTGNPEPPPPVEQEPEPVEDVVPEEDVIPEEVLEDVDVDPPADDEA